VVSGGKISSIVQGFYLIILERKEGESEDLKIICDFGRIKANCLISKSLSSVYFEGVKGAVGN
jgi:hypothetical protein